MSRVLTQLGRRAVVNIARLAEDGQKEDVRLRANQDLADRSPETAKHTKVDLGMDLQLPHSEIAALTKALTDSAEAREVFARAASGDYITVDDETLPRRLTVSADSQSDEPQPAARTSSNGANPA